MYRFSELGAMVRARKGEARDRILKAFGVARGEEAAAAKELGVSARSLRRWVVDLGLKTTVDRIWKAEQARRRAARLKESA